MGSWGMNLVCWRCLNYSVAATPPDLDVGRILLPRQCNPWGIPKGLPLVLGDLVPVSQDGSPRFALETATCLY
jgi:hypothetical protein